jgi:hypothetical protein
MKLALLLVVMNCRVSFTASRPKAGPRYFGNADGKYVLTCDRS